MNNKHSLTSFFLRIGLTIVFFYAAISSFLQPQNWIGYFPLWIRSLLPANILLILFSIYELTLGLWLLSNRKIYYAALVAAATLLAIIISNITQLEILFRDIAIFFAALALAAYTKGK